jgi:hypothetical protein
LTVKDIISILSDIGFDGNYIVEDIFGESKDRVWLLCSFYDDNGTNLQKGNLKAFLLKIKGIDSNTI